MRNLKPLTALALTAAGSALVVGFQVPVAGASAVADTAVVATDATTATVAGAGSVTGTSSGSGSTSGSGTSSGSGSTSGSGTSSGSGSTSGSGTSSGSSTTRGSAAATAYADGTFLGATVGEPWGAFQVQATVNGGQLVDVTVVAAPMDGHSSRINNSAIPTLTSQALASQGANVDVISGATWTSESYAASLQAALDQAVAALDAAA